MNNVKASIPTLSNYPTSNNQTAQSQNLNAKNSGKFIKNLPNPTVSFDSKKVTFNATCLGVPPTFCSRYLVEEEEKSNCSPRFVKSSLWGIPESASTLDQSLIPLLVTISPFAELLPNENKVPTVDFQSNEPIRCRLCGAYINPFVKWMHGGKSYSCSLCNTQNQVPDWYFCPIESEYRRTDISSRPELWKGSVDYQVSPSLHYKHIDLPFGPKIVFLIETTHLSSNSELGLINLFCNSLLRILDSCFCSDNNTQFAFITFSRTVDFWRLRPKVSKYSIFPIKNTFCPIPTNLMFSDYKSGKESICNFLKILCETQDYHEFDSCLGVAINCGMLALGKDGGKIMAFFSSMPSVAFGSLKNYEYSEMKPRQFYAQNTSYYSKLGEECVKLSISVDLFSYTNQYLNLSSIAPIVKLTGGQLYYVYNFNFDLHEEKFFFDLHRNLTRTTGYYAVGKLRCSDGISVDRYEGHFKMGDGDLEFPQIDSDKSITVYLKLDGKVNSNTQPCIQWAMMYLYSDNQFYIRVHTMIFKTFNSLTSLYKCCDCEALINHFLRIILRSYATLDLMAIKSLLTKKIIEIFTCYRTNCSSGRSSTQLILPETIKLLPCYIHGAIKSILLTDDPDTFPHPISVDMRVFLSSVIVSNQLDIQLLILYPKIYNLNELYQISDQKNYTSPGDPDCYGLYWLPSTVRALGCRIEDGGIYLADNGLTLSITFVPPINESILYELLDPSTGVFEENPDSTFNTRTFNVIKSIRYQKPYHQSLTMFDYSVECTEKRLFKKNLVEDELSIRDTKDLASKSYYRYLCYIHEKIMHGV